MIEGLNKRQEDHRIYTEAFAHEYGLGKKAGFDPCKSSNFC
jgi:hypothetical protein